MISADAIGGVFPMVFMVVGMWTSLGGDGLLGPCALMAMQYSVLCRLIYLGGSARSSVEVKYDVCGVESGRGRR